jgi:hypothetical protein
MVVIGGNGHIYTAITRLLHDRDGVALDNRGQMKTKRRGNDFSWG